MAVADPIRLRFDAFDLDEANARLTRQGKAVALPPKALAVLCTLARHRGNLVTKNDLLDAVWGHQHVSESLLKSVISEVRSALQDDAKAPRYIETVSRFGYRFIGNVSSAAPPQLVTATAEAAIVGREGELQRIRDAWQRAQHGKHRLLWIAGEPGVGKTTLIEAFVRELGPRVAATSRCVEHFSTGEPYLPLLEVLREISGQEPDLVALMRRIAPTWLLQMPWLLDEVERATLHRELAGAHPDRMIRELRELMERFSANRPIVFILEDIHWCDQGTLRIMEKFARNQEGGAPILWIATFRLTQVIAENHPLRELRQELRAHKLCEEILLDCFAESEVQQFLLHRWPGIRPSEEFVRRLHAHTDGLPLFVANVTDALLEQAGSDPATLQQWLEAETASPLPVPDNLAGVIERQVSRLSPDTQLLLEAASVCGTEFRAGTAADLLGREVDAVRERCDQLVRAQLWLKQVAILDLPDGSFDARYAFRHALYQHVLYQRMALSQRVQLHRKAVRSLKENRVVGETLAIAELASHHERGHEHLAAMRLFTAAASTALSHFAPRDAAHLSSHALTLAPRCPESLERLELELALAGLRGVAASQLYGIAAPEAQEAFERVRQLCDRLPQTPARALTLNGLGWTYYVRGDYEDSIALARRLEELAAKHEDALLFVLACNLAGVTLIALGKLVDGCNYLERGIARCTELGDELQRAEFVIDPEVSMRLNVAMPLADRGLADQARLHHRLGGERAQRLQQPMAVMLTHWAGGMIESRVGNPTGALPHAQALGELVDRVVLPQGFGPALWLRGLAEAHAGDAVTGYRHIIEGYQCHARLGMYGGCTEALGYAADALILQRKWPEAQRQLDEAFVLAERIGERLALPDLWLLQSRIALGTGEGERAETAVREALSEARAQAAKTLELKALTTLGELPCAKRSDFAALDSALRAMTEGFDTPVVQRARAALVAAG